MLKIIGGDIQVCLLESNDLIIFLKKINLIIVGSQKWLFIFWCCTWLWLLSLKNIVIISYYSTTCDVDNQSYIKEILILLYYNILFDLCTI